MKLWKVAAVLAAVAVPILLFAAKKEEPIPIAGDPDNIFEEELTAE